MFNRHDGGMSFGAHVNGAIRAIPGAGGMRMRADVSSTLFLTDPADYDGGELVVCETQWGPLPEGSRCPCPQDIRAVQIRTTTRDLP